MNQTNFDFQDCATPVVETDVSRDRQYSPIPLLNTS